MSRAHTLPSRCSTLPGAMQRRQSRPTAASRRMRRHVVLVAWMLLIHLFGAPERAMAQTEAPNAMHRAEVSAFLVAQLETSPSPVSFLVILEPQVQASALLQQGRPQNALARRRQLYAALTDHARTTQRELRRWLDERQISYRPFYIINMLEVRGDASVVDALSRRADVSRIVANPAVSETHSPSAANYSAAAGYAWLHLLYAPDAQATPNLPYGLLQTKATEVWEMGFTGEGIWVASQDTGVEWEHPALIERYRGRDSEDGSVDHLYNWFDAWEEEDRPTRCDADPQLPCDDHGHGTHTVGTILGNETPSRPTVGMAPDAQWIGCRNMIFGVGTPASYTACFEFFMAPYPQGGDSFRDGRPELAPHIINNSWGCPPFEGCDAESLRQVVQNVRAAGLFVISSAGNYGGRGCESVSDPIAIYEETLTVGAVTASRAIAGFSSRGPVTVDGSGRRKPDLVAPGVGILSTTVNGGYATLQGTSMASPHVAGAAALLWSAVPALIGDIDLSEQILIKSTEQAPVSVCADDEDDANANANAVVPNNVFGYGHLDVRAAIELALQPFNVTVEVLGENTAGIADYGVLLVDTLTGYTYLSDTPYTGVVRFSGLVAGDYQLQIIVNDQILDGGILEVNTSRGDYQLASAAGEFRVRLAVDQVGPVVPSVYLPVLNAKVNDGD